MIHLSGHQKAWEGLVTAVERRDLLDDPRFATRNDRWHHHYDIVPILQAEFEKKPRDHWLAALDAVSVPNAPIYKIEEVLDDPQVKELGLPQEIRHPTMGASNLIGNAIQLSDTPMQFHRAAPLLGENTDEILRELGYDDDALAELREGGVTS